MPGVLTTALTTALISSESEVLTSGNESSYDNGIHLNFETNKFWTKAPGQPVNLAAFTSLFTFTGDNKSYYRGPTGLLIASVTNTPRIEYDANGNLLGLLIEGARTNLALWSNDWTNAAWVKSNVTAAKTATGPDGVANSATTLTASAGNGTVLQTVTSGSATRAFGTWIKRRTGTGNIDFTVDNGSTWTTQTLTTSWSLCQITQTAVTNPVFGVRIVTSGDAVDVWCGQLESAPFTSSAIPTTTASVARAAETIQRTFGTEFDKTIGTALCKFNLNHLVTAATGTKYILFVDANGYYLYLNTNNNAPQTYDGATALVGSALSPSLAVGPIFQNHKIASTLGGSTMINVGDNQNTTSAAFDGTIGAASTVNIGSDSSGASSLFGHILRLDYWPEKILAGQLKALTV